MHLQVVVRHSVSDLIVSENLPRAEEMGSLDVELFMKDPPLLSNLTLKAVYCHSYTKGHEGCCFTESLHLEDNWNAVENTITHNHTQSQSEEEMSTCERIHGNTSQQYCNIYCKRMIVNSNTSHTNTHKLLHTFNLSMHLQPSENSKSEVSADEKVKVGSHVVLTLSLNNVIVINQKTNKWHINMSLKEAFDRTGWASISTKILVQDAVGDLVLNIPPNVTANQNDSVFCSIGSGSLLVNGTLLYRNSSYRTGEEAKVVLLFYHTGTLVVELKADNRMSSQSKGIRMWVKEKRESAPQSSTGKRTLLNEKHTVTNRDFRFVPKIKSKLFQLFPAVKIHAAKQAYPTNTDVTLLALTDVQESMDFFWHFGDSTSARTISGTITKRYRKPGRCEQKNTVPRT